MPNVPSGSFQPLRQREEEAEASKPVTETSDERQPVARSAQAKGSDAAGGESAAGQKPAIVRVRGGPAAGEHEMQIDVPTLVTLIQQGILGATAEANGEKLTGGEWKKLGDLEVFKTFRPTGQKAGKKAGIEPELPEGAQGLEAHERNLLKYFGSFDVNRMRLDGWAAIASAALVAVLSVIAHRSLLTFLLVALGWGAGYLFMDRIFFPAWIRKVRSFGFKGLPWNSRNFLIVAVAVPCYFLAASFLPLLSGEGLLRFVDGVVCILFSAAAAAVWTFRVCTLRAQRVFELSREAAPRVL